MGYAKLKSKISIEDYLSGEEISQIRHEFLDGEVYAMAGASQNHNRIAGNLFNCLSRHLEGSPCEPYMEGMKVKAADNVFYYPDILVTCEGNFKNPYYGEAPILIIEVISPPTARIDRGEKLRAYQQIPSVREYVLVDQDKIAVEIRRRQPDGRWITDYFDRNDADFTLQSVELTVPLTDVYRRVAFNSEA